MDRLNRFCNTQDGSAGLPATGELIGCDQILEALRNSSGRVEPKSLSDLLDQILEECSRDPAHSAQRSDDVGPLVWGVVLFPVGVLLIALSVHFVTRPRKERPNPDSDSGNSLISIDMKDPTAAT